MEPPLAAVPHEAASSSLPPGLWPLGLSRGGFAGNGANTSDPHRTISTSSISAFGGKISARAY